jgi:hypothetical protein
MPFVGGNTLTGWGVVRNAPWHFAGMFASKAEADAKAAEMGEGYEVYYGENREGSDDFIWAASQQGTSA